jgi:hypothetical protein
VANTPDQVMRDIVQTENWLNLLDIGGRQAAGLCLCAAVATRGAAHQVRTRDYIANIWIQIVLSANI